MYDDETNGARLVVEREERESEGNNEMESLGRVVCKVTR